jgi:hypothetical protein
MIYGRAHQHIHVTRHGAHLAITLDGVPLPDLVTGSVSVIDDANIDMPALSLTLYANRITLDASIVEVDDGQDEQPHDGQETAQPT